MLNVLAHGPGGESRFHDGENIVIEWEPDGRGDTYPTVTGPLTLSRLPLLEHVLALVVRALLRREARGEGAGGDERAGGPDALPRNSKACSCYEERAVSEASTGGAQGP